MANMYAGRVAQPLPILQIYVLTRMHTTTINLQHSNKMLLKKKNKWKVLCIEDFPLIIYSRMSAYYPSIAPWAAASLAIGTLNGEHDA